MFVDPEMILIIGKISSKRMGQVMTCKLGIIVTVKSLIL